MKLLVQTPFFESSDFMAHLIEHCVLHQRSFVETFSKNIFWGINASGSLSGEYTTYSFDTDSDPKDFFDHLTCSIDPEIISYEYAIFEEEFGSIGYVVRAFEKLFRKIYTPKRAGGIQSYSYESITEYHRTIYSEDNYVIYDFDKAHTLIHHRSLTHHELVVPRVAVHQVLLEGENNTFVVVPHTPGGLVFANWLELLIDAFDKSEKRYRLGSYYTHQTSRRTTQEHSIIRIGPHTRWRISEEFFGQMIAALPHYIATHFFLQTRAMCILRHATCPSNDEIFSFLHAVSFTQIDEILEQCEVK